MIRAAAIGLVLLLGAIAPASAMPWPCWLVRWHASGKTEAQLEEIARHKGVKITPRLREEVRACLKGSK